jgi:phage baseplate assembly protein V
MHAADIKQMISGALASVRQALKGKVTRATGATQVILVQAEGFKGETFNKTPFPQLPGFRGMPVAGMQPVIIPLNGKSANGVIVAMSNGTLFIADLQDGECALFNENDGVANSLILRNGKVAELTTETFNVNATTINLNAATTNINGDANVLQTLTAATDVVGGGKSLKSHRHPGIEPGSGVTGPTQ